MTYLSIIMKITNNLNRMEIMLGVFEVEIVTC